MTVCLASFSHVDLKGKVVFFSSSLLTIHIPPIAIPTDGPVHALPHPLRLQARPESGVPVGHEMRDECVGHDTLSDFKEGTTPCMHWLACARTWMKLCVPNLSIHQDRHAHACMHAHTHTQAAGACAKRVGGHRVLNPGDPAPRTGRLAVGS